MGDGALRGSGFSDWFPGRLRKRGWSGEEGSGNEGKHGHLRPPPLLCEPFQCEGSVCILSESTPGQRRQEESSDQKDPKGDVLYMQSIVSAVFPDGVSPKKAHFSDNGSKREQAGSAADGCISNSASAEQTLFQVPPGFRLTMSVAHVSARSVFVCLFVLRKEALSSTQVCRPFRDSKFAFASQAEVNGSCLLPLRNPKSVWQVLSRQFERPTSCLVCVCVCMCVCVHLLERKEGNLRKAGPKVAAVCTVLSGYFPSEAQAGEEKPVF